MKKKYLYRINEQLWFYASGQSVHLMRELIFSSFSRPSGLAISPNLLRYQRLEVC